MQIAPLVEAIREAVYPKWVILQANRGIDYLIWVKWEWTGIQVMPIAVARNTNQTRQQTTLVPVLID